MFTFGARKRCLRHVYVRAKFYCDESYILNRDCPIYTVKQVHIDIASFFVIVTHVTCVVYYPLWSGIVYGFVLDRPYLCIR